MESEAQPFDAVFKQKAQVLLDNLEQGDVGTAVKELISINDARTNSMYQQIGKIARSLHDSLSKLDISASDSTGSGEKAGDGRDVNTRIHYVIDLTQEAANKTMDLADESTPIAAELGSESAKLRQEWSKLKKRELSAEEFRNLYARIDDFLAYSEEKSNHLHTNLTDIVVTQGYQDLSGQVLQKIVEMLETTENDLVSLLSITASIQNSNSLEVESPEVSAEVKAEEKDIVAEGPVPSSKNTMNNQDEVDDLLSSLGF